MKNKSSLVVKKNTSNILKRKVLVNNTIGICINCGVKEVKIESNDETSKDNPTQE
jgi:hypothetical protein